MAITVDVAYKSLNKFTEVLCGDKVELLKTDDSNIMILADGMGSGVKANILATLTSKILGTMFLNGATLEECVETIVETLPICKVRQVAYSTFSILQVFHSGAAYLVEFDNPSCIFIRNGSNYDGNGAVQTGRPPDRRFRFVWRKHPAVSQCIRKKWNYIFKSRLLQRRCRSLCSR